MAKKTIILAADHAGFALKEVIKTFLQGQKYEVLDVGAHSLTPEDDYPVYMTAAAMKVASDLSGNTKAVVFGGSGNGEAIVCNRFPSVRAIVWYGDPAKIIKNQTGDDGSHLDIIKLSREHNDANVLSIGARFVNEDETKKAVISWIETPFSREEKHQRRIEEIDNIQ